MSAFSPDINTELEVDHWDKNAYMFLHKNDQNQAKADANLDLQ